jgi:hypothetical protein
MLSPTCFPPGLFDTEKIISLFTDKFLAASTIRAKQAKGKGTGALKQ